MIPMEEAFSTMFDCTSQMFFKLFFPPGLLNYIFAFNLLGFMILFIFFIWIQLLHLNDAFSILINSFTSQIFSSLFHHTCFLKLFLKFFLTDSVHWSSAFSRMFFGSPCAIHEDFVLSDNYFSFFLNNFPPFHIRQFLDV